VLSIFLLIEKPKNKKKKKKKHLLVQIPGNAKLQLHETEQAILRQTRNCRMFNEVKLFVVIGRTNLSSPATGAVS
jgi:hypothetical protein